MPDRATLVRYLDEATARATGSPPDPAFDVPPPRGATINVSDAGVRHHLETASAHADLGAQARGGKMAAARSTMLRALRPITAWQVRYNEEIVAAVEALADELDQREESFRANAATVAAIGDDLSAALATAGAELDQHRKQVTEALAGIQQRLDELTVEVAAARTDTKALRSRLDLTLYAAREALPEDLAAPRLQHLSRQLDPSHDELYRDLEAEFRGSREQVRGLVAAYVGDIEAVGGPVVDIGSGRNEWLEVLAEHGIEATGVDTNAAFADDAEQRGLHVVQADALEYLMAVPEGSLGAVTGFHIAEHLDLESLLALLAASLVALRPGGLLLLETPNPTNLNVGANTFYLDPTHLKPLQPQFLEFLLLRQGFARVEIRHVHPTPNFDTELVPGPDAPATLRAAYEKLSWALFGPQDYAALAHTAAAPT